MQTSKAACRRLGTPRTLRFLTLCVRPISRGSNLLHTGLGSPIVFQRSHTKRQLAPTRLLHNFLRYLNGRHQPSKIAPCALELAVIQPAGPPLHLKSGSVLATGEL